MSGFAWWVSRMYSLICPHFIQHFKQTSIPFTVQRIKKNLACISCLRVRSTISTKASCSSHSSFRSGGRSDVFASHSRVREFAAGVCVCVDTVGLGGWTGESEVLQVCWPNTGPVCVPLHVTTTLTANGGYQGDVSTVDVGAFISVMNEFPVLLAQRVLINKLYPQFSSPFF